MTMRSVLLALFPAVVALEALAAQAPPAGPVVIQADRVLDGRGGVIRDTRIVIEHGKIARLDSKAAGATYDLRGYTVLPGWIDVHVHIGSHFGRDGRIATDKEPPAEAALGAAANAWRTLMAGFTTVQSVGEASDKALRDAIAAGGIPGPRILTSLDPIFGRGDTTGSQGARGGSRRRSGAGDPPLARPDLRRGRFRRE